MDQSSPDRNGGAWVCSVCGRARQSPFTSPCLGQARSESCRACGETLAGADANGANALPRAIGGDLI